MSRQMTLESFSCCSKTALGRPQGNGEHAGDFAEAQLFELVQDEDFSTAMRHAIHRVVEHDARATQTKKMLGVDVERGLGALCLFVESSLVTDPHTTHVARLMRRCAKQERALFARRHVVELAMKREENFLCCIVDIGVGNTETSQYTADEAHLLADHCAKSSLARRLCGVVFFHAIARGKNQS